MPKSENRDYIDWDAGREGYVPSPNAARQQTVHSQKPGRKSSAQNTFLTIQREERFGSLVAAGGIIWGVYIATQDYASLWRFDLLSPGPLEVCALGILAWLHAKWRRSLKSS